jgi:hypothetical protein
MVFVLRAVRDRLGVAGARRITTFDVFKRRNRTSFGSVRAAWPNLNTVLQRLEPL